MRAVNAVLRVLFLGGGGLLTLVWLSAGLFTGQWLTAWLAGPILLAVAALEWRTWGAVDSAFGPDEDGNDFFAIHSDSLKRSFWPMPLGQGRIVGLTRTGTSINEEPQFTVTLDVETPDGRRFRGITTEVIPPSEMHEYEAGAIFLVRYDPGEHRAEPDAPHRVAFAVDLDESEALDARLAVERGQGRLDADGERTFRLGVTAVTEGPEDGAPAPPARVAVVRSCTATGEVHGGPGHANGPSQASGALPEPVLDLHLTVHRPDGTTFDVHTRDHFGPPALQALVPGSIVQVRYLPEHEQDLALVFEHG